MSEPKEMLFKSVVLLILSLVIVRSCYWNDPYPYNLFGSKTPYETVRGDIRDIPNPENCEAVSLWTLNRHGNRNYDTRTVRAILNISTLKDDVIASYEAGKGHLCAQDIENLKTWTWNTTIEGKPSVLTDTGYEELYNIGKRIREKYPHLVQGSPDLFYFRPTIEQRNLDSCTAFVNGFTEGTGLNLTIDSPREKDPVIRPYLKCDRYMRDVKYGPALARQLDTYFDTPDFLAVQAAVQDRLGVTPLTWQQIFAIYELCRYHLSWSKQYRSAWCAAFSGEDLLVLEYFDDYRQYHFNGYGSPNRISMKLGYTTVKDLYEKLEEAVKGNGKKIVSYFTHDTMMQMTYSAMGIGSGDIDLHINKRNPQRRWRSSFIGANANNLIAVLNNCVEGGHSTFRVQLFQNEKPTDICPVEGCSWQEFQDKFSKFTKYNTDACSIAEES